jgi:hypothetical protein
MARDWLLAVTLGNLPALGTRRRGLGIRPANACARQPQGGNEDWNMTGPSTHLVARPANGPAEAGHVSRLLSAPHRQNACRIDRALT